jgi:hypothetical protein
MYVSTPEKDAAAARADQERREVCARQLLRYDAEKRAEIERLKLADNKDKQKAVIAFQTGRKYY